MFTLYNLLCDNPGYQMRILEVFAQEHILPTILSRMVAMATTEYIIPALDVVFCASSNRTALLQVMAHLHCVVAVQKQIIPIKEHQFGSVSSYKPNVC